MSVQASATGPAATCGSRLKSRTRFGIVISITDAQVTLPAIPPSMPNATARPTSAQLLLAHTRALQRIAELHAAVNDMPLLEAADDETFDRFFAERNDLNDAIEGLAQKFLENTRV